MTHFCVNTLTAVICRSRDTRVYVNRVCDIFMTHWVRDNQITQFCARYVDSSVLPVRETLEYMHIVLTIFWWLIAFATMKWLISVQGTSTAVACPFVSRLCICTLSLWYVHDSLSSCQADDLFLREVRRERWFARSWDTCIYVNWVYDLYMTHWVRGN